MRPKKLEDGKYSQRAGLSKFGLGRIKQLPAE
jgi:hypothetical protein